MRFLPSQSENSLNTMSRLEGGMVGLPPQWSWAGTNTWFHAALILLLFAALGWIFENILVVGLKRATAKTKSDLDDILVHVAARPVFFIILLVGLKLATLTVRELDAHRATVNGGFYVLTAILVAWLGARIFSFITLRWFKAHRGLSGTPRLLNIIAGVIIWLIAGIIILAHFEVEITPFLATLGVGGLAVGLALQGTLSNIFAGMHIVGDQPVRVGDFIEIEDGKVSGIVEDIGWRSTRIRTRQDYTVIIPNARLADSVIQNFSMPDGKMRVGIACGVDYGSDLERVEHVTIEVLTAMQGKVRGVPKDARPEVRFQVFGESNVDFMVWCTVQRPEDRFFVKHEIVKRLHARYAKEGIEISWPVRKIVNGKTGEIRR